jgi:phage/conjugal plasmid C-4 type zinc finger TraR family protein
MADFADIAATCEANFRADALAARTASAAHGGSDLSATECEECGEPIPEARRRAVPGCTRCTECQKEFERQIV